MTWTLLSMVRWIGLTRRSAVFNTRPVRVNNRPAALAGDPFALSQGLDGSERNGWRAFRGFLPFPPGSDSRPENKSRTPAPFGRLAAFLPCGGTVRRAGASEAGDP